MCRWAGNKFEIDRAHLPTQLVVSCYMQQFSHHSHLSLFTGENLVSKSPLQVQASGEGEGNGGTESQQSGELAARTLPWRHVVNS